MFAIQCQFCRHDNVPGARFCADCGSPLHLKPCPKCGKVDDVAAKACYACGTEFPAITTAAVAAAPAGDPVPAKGGTAAPLRPSAAPATPIATPTPVSPAPPAARKAAKPRAPAWPLILVAALAGGLPLVWMNRAHLPLPQAWRIGDPGSSTERSPARSVTAPLTLPPPTGSATQGREPPAAVVPVAPVVPPARSDPSAEPGGAVAPPAAPAPPLTPAATPEPPPAAAESDAQRSKTAAQDPAPRARNVAAPPKRSAERPRPAATASARPAASAPAPKAEAPAKTLPAAPAGSAQRECSEAVAALGLCDPKRDAK